VWKYFIWYYREDAKKEYNADYHRRHYRRLTPDELSAVRRANVNKRWRQDAA
jgi:hypothetical protein